MKGIKRIFKLILFALIVFAFSPQTAFGFTIGETQTFNIESSYDATGREQLTATLKKVTANAYFYIDDAWWLSLSQDQQLEATNSLNIIGEEFDSRIYPLLVQNFGDVWNPGIDKDTRITILIQPMKNISGAYFNTADEYSKLQIPRSNEREMIYLNANYINNLLIKTFLAHEFQHMINFNQKDRTRGVTEDVWLNEARSEYTSTLLGYDAVYGGSGLEKRVKNFLDKPYDSLTEWKNQSADYGVVNLFIHYLVDHYGIDVLKESMLSSKTGIDSLKDALKKLGFVDTFSQIFTNWTVASFINDCNLDIHYCYLNESLRNFRVAPQANFLPPVPQTSLSVVNTAKGWSGNWYKFFGIKGNLSFEFAGSAQSSSSFKIPYLLENKQGKYSISFLNLDFAGKGKIDINDFDKTYSSLIIIPSIYGKATGFSDNEPSIQFSWTVSVSDGKAIQENQKEIERLLAIIADLTSQIQKIRQQLADMGKIPAPLNCAKFNTDLYYGMANSAEVKCLQEFLISKRYLAPGFDTGNYYSLTVIAVKSYQKANGITPVFGYFGPLTRRAVNIDSGL